MARNQRRDELVSDAEFEALSGRISEHFDRIRARLSDELGSDDTR